GLKIANGDYVAYLDADDIWKQNHLSNLVEVLSQTSSDVVYSKYKWFSERQVFDNPNINQDDLNLFDTWFDSDLAPSTALISKHALLVMGGWDECLAGCEDMDLWFRLHLNGYRFCCSDKYDVLIRVHEANTKANSDKMYANHIKSLLKWVSII